MPSPRVRGDVGVAAGITVSCRPSARRHAKTANGFLRRASQRFEGTREKRYFSSVRSSGLTAAIPTFAVLLFGADAVNAFLSVMPSWFTTGLSIAAGILPVVGLAMLLSFMPMKKFIAYAIVGFVLAAYLQISILPIALLGAAAAIEYYKSHSNPSVNALDAGGLEDE
ncbi:MAG: PTS sugar transporter subunit IIC [Collinsella sp.]